MARHESPPTEISALLPSATSIDAADDLLERVESGKSYNGPAQTVTVLRGLLISLSIFLLIFLQASNFSLITTTQSAIAKDLDAFAQASWFTSAYLIAMSSITPLTGRLSQMFSPRNVICISVVIFSCGTLLTAFSPALSSFLVGRAMTGAGAAGILPVSMVLVLELTGKKRRGLYIGLVNTGYTFGVALGAVIAGALEPIIGWRAVFWIQIPIAFILGTCLFFSIPSTFKNGAKVMNERTVAQTLKRVDYLGVITLTSAIVLLLLSLSWPRIPVLPIVLSLVLLCIFVFVEVRVATEPIIPITVLKSRGALLTCLSTLGFMASRWTILFYTPVYAIAVRGWSSASAGSILVPTNAGFALGGLLVGWIHIRRSGSFYLACLVTYICFPITLFILGQLSTEYSAASLYVLATASNGFCAGAALNYTLAHLLHLSFPETHFIVTSLLAAFRGFAGSFGSAIGGGVFTRVLKKTLELGFHERGSRGKAELVRQLLGSPALVSSLTGVDREVAILAYVTAFKTLFTAASLVALSMVVLQAGTGWRGMVGRKATDEIEGDGEEDVYVPG